MCSLAFLQIGAYCIVAGSRAVFAHNRWPDGRILLRRKIKISAFLDRTRKMHIKNAGTGFYNQPSAFSSANNAAWREEQTARPYLGEKETAGNGNLKKLWLRSRREQPMPPAPSSFDGFDSVAFPLLPFVPPNKPSDTCSCTSLRALLAFFKQVLPAFENGELPLRFQKQGRVPPPLPLAAGSAY